MKTIYIKTTKTTEVVSDEYFENYKSGGWFIEVLPEPVKEPEVKEPKAPKVKAKTVKE